MELPVNPEVDIKKKIKLEPADIVSYDQSNVISPEMLSKLTEINKLNAYTMIKNKLEMARLEQVEANNYKIRARATGMLLICTLNHHFDTEDDGIVPVSSEAEYCQHGIKPRHSGFVKKSKLIQQSFEISSKVLYPLP